MQLNETSKKKKKICNQGCDEKESTLSICINLMDIEEVKSSSERIKYYVAKE